MPRLLLVSNRLPVTVKLDGDAVNVAPSAGGLATGLSGPHQRSGGLWVGWPGDVSRFSNAQQATLDRALQALRCVPLQLSASEVRRYYEGFSNRVLWPLFHDLIDRIPEHPRDWDVYRKVNVRFADKVAAVYQPGDTIWVQDYQLLLVPQLLRDRLPTARIGFFLHIPFPAADIFRTLPWRREVLEGLLGADLIGFHTLGFARHFAEGLTQVLGLSPEVDTLHHHGRTVRIGAFPMGIDAAAFAQGAERPEVLQELAVTRASAPGEKLLVGVDRLDYTKGLRRRLLAYARLLEQQPALRGKVRFIQVAVPSRTGVAEYEQYRESVDALVGRINGTYGTAQWMPVHYLFRSLSSVQLSALYRAADVMLVTPLRDGMNLVSKEFIASRSDGDGVLVLSELAGAASELGESLVCNPYDVDGMAERFHEALRMPEAERRARMGALRERVLRHDVNHWVKSFLGSLEAMPAPSAPTPVVYAAEGELAAITARFVKAKRWCLFLDYDGTLRSFTTLPALATPDPELLELLRALAARPGAQVHVVSGRPIAFLQQHLGGLEVGLHGEHGLYSQPARGAPLRPNREVSTTWKAQLRPLLEEFVDRTPGSFVEEKSASMAWHYRKAEPVFAAAQAHELQLHVAGIFSNAPVQLLCGDKVLEVRAAGVDKGLVVGPTLAALEPDVEVLAMGDDTTDEDLFAALPRGAVAIHVGPRQSIAPVRLRDVASARRLLRSLLG